VTGRRLAAWAAVAFVLILVAWVGLRPGDTEPVERMPEPSPVVEVRQRVDAEAPRAEPATLEPLVDDTDSPRLPPEPPPVGPARRAGIERAGRIEGAVLMLLGSVAPELDLDQVEGDCARNGRRCTFHGPWPGDDFLGRWVRATGDGFISSADLDGLVIERFEPVENEAGELQFEIVAKIGSPDRR